MRIGFLLALIFSTLLAFSGCSKLTAKLGDGTTGDRPRAPVLGDVIKQSDSFQLSPTSAASAVAGVSDYSGRVFVVGSAYDITGLQHWIVRVSRDGGQTWATLRDLSPNGPSNEAWSVAVNPNDNSVYVAGRLSDNVGNTKFHVEKTTDGGVSWIVVDDYAYPSGNLGYASSVLVNSNGDVITVGASYENPSPTFEPGHGIVRRMKSGETNFATVFDYHEAGSGECWFYSASLDPSGKIYVSGYKQDAAGLISAVVFVSTDNGDHFTQIDDYIHFAGYTTTPRIGYADAAGYYLPIRAYDAAGMEHWVLKFYPVGGSAIVIEEYVPGLNLSASSSALLRDLNGGLYVSGRAQDSAGNYYEVIRRSLDNGLNWTTVENVLAAPGLGSFGRVMFLDRTNNLYVLGAIDANNDPVGHTLSWSVRKLEAK